LAKEWLESFKKGKISYSERAEEYLWLLVEKLKDPSQIKKSATTISTLVTQFYKETLTQERKERIIDLIAWSLWHHQGVIYKPLYQDSSFLEPLLTHPLIKPELLDASDAGFLLGQVIKVKKTSIELLEQAKPYLKQAPVYHLDILNKLYKSASQEGKSLIETLVIEYVKTSSIQDRSSFYNGLTKEILPHLSISLVAQLFYTLCENSLPAKKDLSIASQLLTLLLEKKEPLLNHEELKERLIQLDPILKKGKNNPLQAKWHPLALFLSPPPSLPPQEEESVETKEKEVKSPEEVSLPKSIKKGAKSSKKAVVIKPAVPKPLYLERNPMINATPIREDLTKNYALLYTNQADREAISHLLSLLYKSGHFLMMIVHFENYIAAKGSDLEYEHYLQLKDAYESVYELKNILTEAMEEKQEKYIIQDPIDLLHAIWHQLKVISLSGNPALFSSQIEKLQLQIENEPCLSQEVQRRISEIFEEIYQPLSQDFFENSLSYLNDQLDSFQHPVAFKTRCQKLTDYANEFVGKNQFDPALNCLKRVYLNFLRARLPPSPFLLYEIGETLYSSPDLSFRDYPQAIWFLERAFLEGCRSLSNIYALLTTFYHLKRPEPLIAYYEVCYPSLGAYYRFKESSIYLAIMRAYIALGKLEKGYFYYVLFFHEQAKLPGNNALKLQKALPYFSGEIDSLYAELLQKGLANPNSMIWKVHREWKKEAHAKKNDLKKSLKKLEQQLFSYVFLDAS